MRTGFCLLFANLLGSLSCVWDLEDLGVPSKEDFCLNFCIWFFIFLSFVEESGHLAVEELTKLESFVYFGVLYLTVDVCVMSSLRYRFQLLDMDL